MITHVTKRNGRKVKFNKKKVQSAVLKAWKVLYDIDANAKAFAEKVANEIESISYTDILTVEEIQDLVEKKLMVSSHKDIAKVYINYRQLRAIARHGEEALWQAIGGKLRAEDVQNQNANIDEHSFGGRVGEASGIITKQYALDYLLSPMAKENHLNNEIYIHDLDSYATGMHNCCARDTKFITKDYGVQSFENYNDGDIVTVLNHKGGFNKATVKKFGIQKLNKITFSFAGQSFVTERFTANHRWLLADGTETTNLKIGDKLYKAPIHIRNFNWDTATDKERYYWCLGFILVDGTEAYHWSHGKKNEDIKFIRMRLCGDKVQYESRFSGLKHSTKEMDNGDLYLTFSSTIGFRKVFPDLGNMTHLEKLALFDGLYSANGQHSGNRKSILTTDEQIASFIEDEVPALGYFILNIKDRTGEQTNCTTRKFTKEYTFIGDANKYYWTVVDIAEDAEEEVWCLQVENTHSFVLPNGITTGNCLTIPFDKLLAEGFNTRQTDVRPANSINTAMQLVAVIFQLQSLQQFGGVSASHLDWTMVPYVRRSFYKHYLDGLHYCENSILNKSPNFKLDTEQIINTSIDDEIYKKHKNAYQYALDMTTKETYQAVEGMYHNLNTLQSRSGNQLPFTSINYGTCTLSEGRLVTKAILDTSIKGLGKFHKTSIFPCGIFQYWDKVNGKPGTPNYDLYQLALKSTAKRLYPNYANISWSGNAGFDENDPCTYFSTMGCRTANGADINAEPGVNAQTKDGRGNICPVTIILPTIAMEAKEEYEIQLKEAEELSINPESLESIFMNLLDKKIHEAKDMLIERFEWICSQDASAAKFMYENGTMMGYKPEEGIQSALKHGTIVIGQLGLAECLQALIGTDHTTNEGMKFAKKIEGLFKKRCAEFKKEYKLNFGVYYTPAENLCKTAMTKFKQKYGELPNISDRDYFTNSMHVPVWHEMDPYEKIDIESQLTPYSSAGCITYVELDADIKHNIEALEKIVNYAMEHDIPYFAVNVPVDLCPACGYEGVIDNDCPICGNKSEKIQRLRRVTGYLTGSYTSAFNSGKQAEVKDRVKHNKTLKGDC